MSASTTTFSSSLPIPSPTAYPSNHPSLPPRSALRVNTDFGRMRSNSSAQMFRPSPYPADITASGPSTPMGTTMNMAPPIMPGASSSSSHQFSRSLSHASPLSPGIAPHDARAKERRGLQNLSGGAGGMQQGDGQDVREGRERRDVFMAVRNLRGLGGTDSPLASPPISPAYRPSDLPPVNGNAVVQLDASIASDIAPDSDAAELTFTGGGQYSEAADVQPVPPTEEAASAAEGNTLGKISQALKKSSDGGDTLDLSRRGIERIGPQAVDHFRRGVGQDKKGVWRLALSYNALRDGGVDMSFSRLTRLRYLNLKGNQFTQFPPALTEMPALEILDLSKNRLTSFPDQPGRLVYLKVLSLTNNKICALPSYMTQFNSLKLFKVDANPIEWPPKEVLGALVESGESPRARDAPGGSSKVVRKDEDLRPWIENMKSWMRQRVVETDRLLDKARADDEIFSDYEPLTAASITAEPVSAGPWTKNASTVSLTALSSQPSQHTIRPIREDGQERSASPAPVAKPIRPSLGFRSRSTTLSSDIQGRPFSPVRPPPLRIVTEHHRAPSTDSFASPLDSAATASTSAHSRQHSANLPPPPPIPAANTGHSRGASYTATQRMSATLSAKKSLPDLRQDHARIIQERRESGHGADEVRPLGLGIKSPSATRPKVPPSPWSAGLIKSPSSGTLLTEREKTRMLGRKSSAEMLHAAMEEGLERRNSKEGPLVDDSRNSYFRRFSTLPVSSISKAIPPALLRFVDAIRGILFALSQIHTALRQYLIFAVSDRIASLFSKVMDPAGTQMTALINALDRFDAMSRRGTPPVAAIQGVVDATKKSITTFAKVIAVLRLQLPAIRNSDARYTRSLLLMVYGSMAEVTYSWTAMVPLLDEVKLLLTTDPSVAARAIFGGHMMAHSASFTGRTPISPIPERAESMSPPTSIAKSERTDKTLGASPLHQSVSAVQPTSPTPPAGGPPLSATRLVGRNRRQAGSFSTQDVEKGMMMGGNISPVTSRDGDHPTPSGPWRHITSSSAQITLPRTDELDPEAVLLSDCVDDQHEALDLILPNPPFALRAGVSNSSTVNLPQTPPEVAAPLQPIAMAQTSSQNSRRGHHPSSSGGSSHMMGHHYPRKLSVDIHPPTPGSLVATAQQIDDDLLDVIESATDVAFTAWLRLAEDVGASHVPSHISGGYGHSKSNSQSSISSAHYTSIGSQRPPTISAKHHMELLDLLSTSEQITSTLRESLMAIRANKANSASEGMPTSASGVPDLLGRLFGELHDHAQAFVKTVVKVTELVMIISTTHTFPGPVKSCCAKLVQFTREFAILFSVSSYPRPGTSQSMNPPRSARSMSPMPFSSGAGAPSVGAGGNYRHWPRGSQGRSRGEGSYGGERVGGPGAEAYGRGVAGSMSHEDLLQPQSAVTPGSSAGWGSGSSGPPSAGLRGLQLPTRQAALARGRAGAAAARG